MSMQAQYEREEEAIIEAANRGEISHAEATKEIKELWRDYLEAARESADNAYRNELERW